MTDKKTVRIDTSLVDKWERLKLIVSNDPLYKLPFSSFVSVVLDSYLIKSEQGIVPQPVSSVSIPSLRREDLDTHPITREQQARLIQPPSNLSQLLEDDAEF